ncbi:MAG: amino acid adenylation domain-containing protein [Clostridia bacterium]
MKNVLEYLEQTTIDFKDKIAAQDGNSAVTYNELLLASQRVGSFLAGMKTARTAIPVFMEKSIDTLSVFFGAVYAGCFYVLINPKLPKSRIEQILEVLETDFVVTSHIYDEYLLEIENIKDVVYIEDIKKTWNCSENAINTTDLNVSSENKDGIIIDEKLREIRKNATDIDPLYVNFTSGSTGTPKGVVICHRSVIDFINEFTKTFDINENDIIGNQAPFDFDVSVKDIYSAIKTGATLEIIPRELFSAPMQLADLLYDRKITTMTWAVSALCLMTTFHVLDYKCPSFVNKVLFSGETMPIKHLKQWMERLPNASFVNLYGPTEITCNCTYYKINSIPSDDKSLPIGSAFKNEKVFLLNENDTLIKDKNVNGEICVSGTTVGLGYYNNQIETAKHFMQNPLNKSYIEIIYRTGDLGYYNDDNLLCFAGRKDFQIKYQGHRIELEEIEMALVKTDGIDRACCVFREEKGQLVAFYIGDLDAKEIRKQLSEVLPAYMLPSKFMPIEAMPLTANGKMDRKKLKAILEEKRR